MGEIRSRAVAWVRGRSRAARQVGIEMWLGLLWIALLGVQLPVPIQNFRFSPTDVVLAILLTVLLVRRRSDLLEAARPSTPLHVALIALAIALAWGSLVAILRTGSLPAEAILNKDLGFGVLAGVVLAARAIVPRSDIRTVLQVIAVSGTAIAGLGAAIAFLGYTGGAVRLAGLLLNPSANAIFLSVVLVVLLSLAGDLGPTLRGRSLAWANAAFLLALIWATASRSTWIALLVSLACVIAARGPRRSLLPAALTAVLLFVSASPLLSALSPVVDRAAAGELAISAREVGPTGTPPPRLRAVAGTIPSTPPAAVATLRPAESATASPAVTSPLPTRSAPVAIVSPAAAITGAVLTPAAAATPAAVATRAASVRPVPSATSSAVATASAPPSSSPRPAGDSIPAPTPIPNAPRPTDVPTAPSPTPVPIAITAALAVAPSATPVPRRSDVAVTVASAVTPIPMAPSPTPLPIATRSHVAVAPTYPPLPIRTVVVARASPPAAPHPDFLSAQLAVSSDPFGATDRIALDLTAVRLWTDRPDTFFAGIGLESFLSVSSYVVTGTPTIIHSSYVWLPVEMGAFGILSVLALFWTALWLIRRVPPTPMYRTFVFGGLALFGTWIAMNEGLYQRSLWLVLALASVLIRADRSRADPIRPSALWSRLRQLGSRALRVIVLIGAAGITLAGPVGGANAGAGCVPAAQMERAGYSPLLPPTADPGWRWTSEGTWTNDLTGWTYCPGDPTFGPQPGSSAAAPPDRAVGWRFTAEGNWENDLTGEVYRPGDDVIAWLLRTAPGSTSEVPPNADPGWRWTAEGTWANDLTGQLYAPGDPTILWVSRAVPGATAERAPNDEPGWRWSSEGEWVNDVRQERYRPGAAAIESTRGVPGSVEAAPSDVPGWRLTSEGTWENDLTGQRYAPGDNAITWLSRPDPGSTPDVPPTAAAGWRWSSDGGWINDLTGDTFRPGDLAIAPHPRVVTRPALGSSADVPPNTESGWRWTSEATWQNDLTGQSYRPGDPSIGWIAQLNPGQTSARAPDDSPGWRWTSNGVWLNDLLGQTYRPGDDAIRWLRAATGSGPDDPPDDSSGWQWSTASGEWRNAALDRRYRPGDATLSPISGPPGSSAVIPPSADPRWRFTADGTWRIDEAGLSYRPGDSAITKIVATGP